MRRWRVTCPRKQREGTALTPRLSQAPASSNGIRGDTQHWTPWTLGAGKHTAVGRPVAGSTQPQAYTTSGPTDVDSARGTSSTEQGAVGRAATQNSPLSISPRTALWTRPRRAPEGLSRHNRLKEGGR